jgi:hypothetical protein
MRQVNIVYNIGALTLGIGDGYGFLGSNTGLELTADEIAELTAAGLNPADLDGPNVDENGDEIAMNAWEARLAAIIDALSNADFPAAVERAIYAWAREEMPSYKITVEVGENKSCDADYEIEVNTGSESGEPGLAEEHQERLWQEAKEAYWASDADGELGERFDEYRARAYRILLAEARADSAKAA